MESFAANSRVREVHMKQGRCRFARARCARLGSHCPAGRQRKKMMNAAPLAEPVIFFEGYNRTSERTPGCCGRVHDISEHRAGFDGSQLVVITQKELPRSA